MENPINLTVRELMERLRVRRTKAYEMLASGDVSHFRVGRKILVPLSSVEAFERRSLKEANP